MSPQRAVVTLLASFSLGLSSYAAAGVATPPLANPSAKSGWVNRIRDARGGLERAHARYETAVNAYGDLRHRRRKRGEEKVAVVQEQETAREAVAQAAQNLDGLLEQARRAGVPPGWIREAMDDPPAEQAH